jgi:hypothetical protein
MAKEISKKFPDSPEIFSTILFLRFLCPTLVSPHKYSLLAEDVELNTQSRNSLILASKMLVQMVTYNDKEEANDSPSNSKVGLVVSLSGNALKEGREKLLEYTSSLVVSFTMQI